VAARHGDAALYDRIAAALAKAPGLEDRELMIFALGSFDDPALFRRALGLLVDPAVDARESAGIWYALLGDRRHGPALLEFLDRRLDELAVRFEGIFQAQLLTGAILFCDEARAADVQRRLGTRATKLAGGPRQLAHVVETVRLCAAARRVNGPQAAAYLGR